MDNPLAELVGVLLTSAPVWLYALSTYRRGELVLRVLRWGINLVRERDQHAKPSTNGNGNGNGNGSASSKQLHESIMLALKSDSARLDITQEVIKQLDRKIEDYALKTQRMVDGVIFGMNDMKRATNAKFEKLDKQMIELLVIARNGNGKHPPEADEQPGDNS